VGVQYVPSLAMPAYAEAIWIGETLFVPITLAGW
jgi:hypothetical protein